MRIQLEPNVYYSIPPGNLFPLNTPNSRPEIYTIRHRNAWRVSVDNQTGWIYWGEVGPDAREDSELGLKGYDEFNQARGRWFQASPEAKLVRIAYEGGNRPPVVRIVSDKSGGMPPLQIQLFSEGTYDAEQDPLGYIWEISEAGGNMEVVTEAYPRVVLQNMGNYTAHLTVTDSIGASASALLPIVSGNEPPSASIELAGNQQFYFQEVPVKYAVEVEDREDGL